MKLPNNFWGWLLLIVAILCITIFFTRSCKSNKVIIQNTTIDTVTIRDTIRLRDTLPTITKSVPVKYIPEGYIPSSKYDSLLKQYEYVIEELFAENYYTDSIYQNNTKVIYNGIVQQNKIQSIGFDIYPEIKEITKTVTVQNNNRQLYIVGGVSSLWKDKDFQFGLNAGISFKDKSDRIYTLTYGRSTIGYNAINFERSFKIHIK